MKARESSVAIYEFRNGKVQQLRSYVDRLSVAEQAAKGWLAKRMVSSIVKQTERGLH